MSVIRKRVTATALATMLAALVKQAMTFDELCALTGLTQVTVSAWIRAMRNQKLVRVCGWDADSRGYQTIARFVWEPGAKDVPRPSKTMTALIERAERDGLVTRVADAEAAA